KKPDFKLSHLIESGNFLVGEQKRVENSHLVDDYNRLNRGRNSDQSSPPAAVTPISQPSNAATQKAKTNGFPKQEISSPHLTLETQAQIRELLSQGYKISIELVDERRF
ncbi:MAG: ribulose 1,5-bisphosphate carboxylase, partial [Nostoc sp.]